MFNQLKAIPDVWADWARCKEPRHPHGEGWDWNQWSPAEDLKMRGLTWITNTFFLVQIPLTDLSTVMTFVDITQQFCRRLVTWWYVDVWTLNLALSKHQLASPPYPNRRMPSLEWFFGPNEISMTRTHKLRPHGDHSDVCWFITPFTMVTLW